MRKIQIINPWLWRETFLELGTNNEQNILKVLLLREPALAPRWRCKSIPFTIYDAVTTGMASQPVGTGKMFHFSIHLSHFFYSFFSSIHKSRKFYPFKVYAELFAAQSVMGIQVRSNRGMGLYLYRIRTRPRVHKYPRRNSPFLYATLTASRGDLQPGSARGDCRHPLT